MRPEATILLANRVSFDQGACLGIPGITAHPAVRVAGPVEGCTVLVQGGSGAVWTSTSTRMNPFVSLISRARPTAVMARFPISTRLPEARASPGIRSLSRRGYLNRFAASFAKHCRYPSPSGIWRADPACFTYTSRRRYSESRS